MTRIAAIAATGGIALVLVTTGSGGSSHNESNATVCKKITADAKSLTSLNGSTNTKQISNKLKSAASSLQSDAKNAKNSDIRSNVSKATSVLNQIGSDLSKGTTPTASKLQSYESQLQSAGSQLTKICPSSSSS